MKKETNDFYHKKYFLHNKKLAIFAYISSALLLVGATTATCYFIFKNNNETPIADDCNVVLNAKDGLFSNGKIFYSYKVKKGSKLLPSIAAIPSKENYKFSYWDINNIKVDDSYIVNEDINVNANYIYDSPELLLITLDAGEGNFFIDKEESVKYVPAYYGVKWKEVNKDLAINQDSNKVFSHFEINGEKIDDDYTFTGSETLKAVYEDVANDKFQLKIRSNGRIYISSDCASRQYINVIINDEEPFSLKDTSYYINDLKFGDTLTFYVSEADYSKCSSFSNLIDQNSTTVDFDLQGDLNGLIPYNKIKQNKAFEEMFYNCNHLLNARSFSLYDITEEDEFNYEYVFYNAFNKCENLVFAPKLPSKKLVRSIYEGMFANCISLVSAPELPANKLANTCYQNMFNGCTSLVSAPELPATELADSCYNSMFSNCTSLINVNKLPAETLRQYCYRAMFKGCTSLKQVPNDMLPGNKMKYLSKNSSGEIIEKEIDGLSNYCYQNMFDGCTSLTNAPELNATYLPSVINQYGTLVGAAYANMFYGCTSLEETPNLPAEKIGIHTYNSMFKGCTNIKKVGYISVNEFENLVIGETEYKCEYAMSSMFEGCSSLSISQDNGDNKFFSCPTTIRTNVNNMFKNTKGPYIDIPLESKEYFYNL